MSYRNPLENMIFVFGSNLAGRHGKGAAKFAADYYGAKYGVGQGPTGQAYALPTKNERIQTLSFDEVAWHCNDFLGYAKSKRDILFQVTRVGCGLAGFTDQQIAPLFKDVSSNVFLSSKWLDILNKLPHARLFVDGQPYSSEEQVDRIVKKVEKMTEPWNKKFELVTDCSGPVSDSLRAWAQKHDVPWTPFPPDSYLSSEQKVYDQQIAWYCSHMIAFTPKADYNEEKRHMFFQQEGLKVKTIAYPLTDIKLSDYYNPPSS